MKMKIEFIDQNRMDHMERMLADVVAQAMLNRRHREKD